MSQSKHSSPAARRYAKALFELASERGRLDSVQSGIRRMGQLVSDVEFQVQLLDPRLSDQRKALAVRDFLGTNADELLTGLLDVLQRRKRTALLADIPRAFEHFADLAVGRLRGVVEAARNLDEATLAALQAALSQGTGKEVVLESQVVPELLGGVRVTLAGTRYDGSARGRLDQITKRLAEAQLS